MSSSDRTWSVCILFPEAKLAIYGDYSHYTSKPLHDFIYESNKGRDFFFVESREEALRKLAEAR